MNRNSYFAKAKPVLEHALATRRGSRQARLARDAFSVMHFVVICGVIALAYGVEEAVAHPSDPLPFGARLAIGLGALLFLGGVAGAAWRAVGVRLAVRLGLAVATALVVTVVPASLPWPTLVILCTGVLAVAVWEQVAWRVDTA